MTHDEDRTKGYLHDELLDRTAILRKIRQVLYSVQLFHKHTLGVLYVLSYNTGRVNQDVTLRAINHGAWFDKGGFCMDKPLVP